MSTNTLIKTSGGITKISLEAKIFSKRCININGEITDGLKNIIKPRADMREWKMEWIRRSMTFLKITMTFPTFSKY